jgi:KipI family sensor histidine kinase inhibitor
MTTLLAPPVPQARLLPLCDAAWTVAFGDQIHPTLQAHALALAERLQALRASDPLWAAVTDVVPTFAGLTLHFNPLSADATALGQRLLALAQQPPPARPRKARRWRLPVCLHADCAPDLPALAQATGLRPPRVLELLLATPFRVCMIGFLPGFPYLTGLPPALAVPRRATPRPRVPAGSLAVAGALCGVYPWESPGGWHLLGRTPLPLFDLRHAQDPAWLAPGDEVQWVEISTAVYAQMLDERAQDTLPPREAFLLEEAQP